MSEKRDLSRAEIARQRRAQRAADELTQTGKRATTPIIQPVTRRATPVAPKATFVQVQKKRQFKIALGLPDVHLRKPQSGRQDSARGWRLTSLVMIFIFTALILLAVAHPYFNIPSVTVLGNDRVSREEISEASGVLGLSIFTVQPEDVEWNLRLAYPEFLSVQAEVYLPNHVYVTVTEREPVILWQQNGGYTWVDAEGVAFRPRVDLPGLIAVNGLANPAPGFAEDPLAPPPFMHKELAQAIMQLAPHVPADTTMFYDGTYGLGWTDARGWNVYFGADGQDMALKVRVYESLAQSLTERFLWPAFINVEYPEAPYYRMAAEVEFKPVTENSGQ